MPLVNLKPMSACVNNLTFTGVWTINMNFLRSTQNINVGKSHHRIVRSASRGSSSCTPPLPQSFDPASLLYWVKHRGMHTVHRGAHGNAFANLLFIIQFTCSLTRGVTAFPVTCNLWLKISLVMCWKLGYNSKFRPIPLFHSIDKRF